MLVVTLPSAWYFIKETKGIPLEAIDKLWQDDRASVAGNTVELGKGNAEFAPHPHTAGSSGGGAGGASRAPA